MCHIGLVCEVCLCCTSVVAAAVDQAWSLITECVQGRCRIQSVLTLQNRLCFYVRFDRWNRCQQISLHDKMETFATAFRNGSAWFHYSSGYI